MRIRIAGEMRVRPLNDDVRHGRLEILPAHRTPIPRSEVIPENGEIDVATRRTVGEVDVAEETGHRERGREPSVRRDANLGKCLTVVEERKPVGAGIRSGRVEAGHARGGGGGSRAEADEGHGPT